MLCLDGIIYPSVLVHLLLHTAHLVVLVGTYHLQHYYMFAGKVGREERLRAMIPPKHKSKPRYLCIYMSVHGVVHMFAHLCVAMFLSTPLHNCPSPCFWHMSARPSAQMPTQMSEHMFMHVCWNIGLCTPVHLPTCISCKDTYRTFRLRVVCVF